eukprot:12418022-Alexandrium_andersonii.AAC.1
MCCAGPAASGQRSGCRHVWARRLGLWLPIAEERVAQAVANKPGDRPLEHCSHGADVLRNALEAPHSEDAEV